MTIERGGYVDWLEAWEGAKEEVRLFGLDVQRHEVCSHAADELGLWGCPFHQATLMCDHCYAAHVDSCLPTRRNCLRCGARASGVHFRDAPPEALTTSRWTGRVVWRAVPLCDNHLCGPLAEYVVADRAATMAELADWLWHNPPLALYTTLQLMTVEKWICGAHPQYGMHPTREALRAGCGSHHVETACTVCGRPEAVMVGTRDAELIIPDGMRLRARFEGSTSNLTYINGILHVDRIAQVCADCAWMWSDRERPIRLAYQAAAINQ